jgi:hypothetical protein
MAARVSGSKRRRSMWFTLNVTATAPMAVAKWRMGTGRPLSCSSDIGALLAPKSVRPALISAIPAPLPMEA